MAWGAINNAVEFMKNELGIDADGREPTHEITAEQREWLSSRHDLSNVRCSVSEALSNSIARQTYLIAYPENKKKGFVPLSDSDE